MSKDGSVERHGLTPYLAARDRQLARIITRISDYLYREPAMALTLIYLITSMVGLLYIILLLRDFDVNAMPHLELTDLMLAAVHHPFVMLWYLALLLVLIVSFYGEKKWLRRWRPYRYWQIRYYKKLKYDEKTPLLLLLLALCYMWVAALVESVNQSELLKQGQAPSYMVDLASPVSVGKESLTRLTDVQVIANLSKYLWLYDVANTQVIMIPHESVLLLTPQLRLVDSAPVVVQETTDDR